MGIRILLADNHKIMRDGLVALIEKQPGMEVIAVAENGRRAVQLTRKLRPDVIVMDINMPGLNGIDATNQIISHSPNAKVIALSIYSDRQFVSEMLKAGASGYLLKDCAFEELTLAIRTVADNHNYLSASIRKNSDAKLE